MDRASNIKDFRNLFIPKVADEIEKYDTSYKYQVSNERFLSVPNGNDRFSICIYCYRRSTFIEIDTRGYYGNLSIENALKRNYSKYQREYEYICGGDVEFICNYYFKKEYKYQYINLKYTNLIYDLDTPISDIVQLWMDNFVNYIQPYFLECTIPEKLNAIVNGVGVETTGMNLTYKNRVLKSLFVGAQAGMSKEQLLELSEKYENSLRQDNLPYLSDFIEVKENAFAKEFK